jgi:hypothetical protein
VALPERVHLSGLNFLPNAVGGVPDDRLGIVAPPHDYLRSMDRLHQVRAPLR